MGPKIIDEFKNKHILIIGDIMLDLYVYGEVNRISPEAPVPVVKINKEIYTLGGAGNVANNLSSLGCKVIMASVIGRDKDGKTLMGLLKDKNIDTSLVMEDKSRITTVKKRVISGNNYQVIRLDYEKTTQIDDELGKGLYKRIQNKIKEIDAVIISDYAKGVVTEKLAKSVIQVANKNNKPVIVDGKPSHLSYFKGCSLITPNIKEAIEMTGIDEDIIKMGEKLVNVLNSNVFITRGAEGISVFDKHGKHTHVLPIKITKLFDVTGAGDTVVAVSSLALVSGLDLVETAKLANFGAGLVVQKPGTATVSSEELKGVFKNEINHFLQESINVKGL